jgi:error-prone DNA polymerase
MPAYAGLSDIMRRADVSVRALEALAKGDAFGSLGLDRRTALWEVRALAGQRWQELPLFAHATRRHHDLAGAEPPVTLPRAQPGEEVAADYRSLGLSLKAHPVRLLARPLAADGWQTCAVAHEARDGQRLRLAGLVTMRQRPGTAGGTVFLTLEDGLHSLNVIIWPKLTETCRDAMLRSQILGVVGRIQREKAVLHFIAESLFNLNGYLRHLDEEAARDQRGTRMRSRDFR